MPNTPSAGNRVLVKLRPSPSALRAAESRANLQPLFDSTAAEAPQFGLSGEAQWFVAELRDGAATPWDVAHARVADQLGVSASDVIFAEPDMQHGIYMDPTELPGGAAALRAVGEQCKDIPQDSTNGKAVGPGEGWHLTTDFSQLAKARAAVEFTAPRTRIAHLDTGYFRTHSTLPRQINTQLERNFVGRDGKPTTAEDPDNRRLVLDNSGHGTGTLSILAGGKVDFLNGDMGAAPEAEIVPLRIADSVVLLFTSAFARALDYAVANGCDVVSMSMGGLPSDAWREAVDRAYMAGVCMVTAAGNNFGGKPTRNIVYPARYSRVIAACGVMADRRPYGWLSKNEMEGNFGPDKVMEHALSAYTPNIPWAVFGCENLVRRNGAGTSSATPQIAAAAALYFEKYKHVLPRSWQRVEAVRHALFSTADRAGARREHFGHGILRAAEALKVAPDLARTQTKPDKDSWAFLRVLTGLGLADATPRERMFNLELAQLWLLNTKLQRIVPDPDDTDELSEKALKVFMDVVIADPRASTALRKHMAARYPVVPGRRASRRKSPREIIPDVLPACDTQPALRDPAMRRVRVYAVDPSFSARLETAGVNEVTLEIPWEKDLAAGPVGEYLAVRDTDAAKKEYEAVDLNDPRLLAQDGWQPSEGNAQFHQQMVYAVAMKTIGHFERALGRPVQWRQPDGNKPFVKHLTIRPHALRQSNAFYSPTDMSLQFGYFEVGDNVPDLMPGSRVYSCLSHDIIAHETTHAILDGMQRLFIRPTNLDVLAFHEAFADIVALMQHFTMPEVLKLEIGRTRGDIEAESMLGSLAVQFGRATGSQGGLRDAIGRVENGVWKRFAPDPAELHRRQTPHARGAILVAAVFDAFLAIYRTRTRDLVRIATGGTGELPAGSIHPDLVQRLSDDAAKSASHVLTMCIRALDYLPPVDVTFFEYLRALITADYDLVSNDRYNYRVAFVEAFRRRGIYPLDVVEAGAFTVRTLSVDTLRWQTTEQLRPALSPKQRGRQKLEQVVESKYAAIIEELREFAEKAEYTTDRETLYTVTRKQCTSLHTKLTAIFTEAPAFARELGLDSKHKFEVDEVRSLMRVSPDGRHTPQVVVSLTQSVNVPASKKNNTPAYTFHGGSTLLVDLSVPEVKYRIVKGVDSVSRRARTDTFIRHVAADPLRALFFGDDRSEPFAALHALAEEGM